MDTLSDDLIAGFKGGPLHVRYRLEHEIVSHEILLPFTPTGEFDLTQTKGADLEIVHSLMQPMIINVGVAAFKHGIILDFWRLIYALGIGVYWTLR